MWEKLKSRKMWAAVAGTAIGTLLAQMGMDADKIAIIVAPIVAFIIGQAQVDKAEATKAPPAASAAVNVVAKK